MPQARYRTLIWDWNGTLLNDAAACRRIINRVLLRRGLPTVSARRYRELFDFPIRTYYENIGFDFAMEPFEKVGSEFIELYEQERSSFRLQPGARALLRGLHAQGFQQIILSAYRQDTLDSLLHEKHLASYFTCMVGADNVYAHGKKDQGLALLQKCQLDRQTTLMVGDTLHDADVAEAMGIDCVLLDAGHQARHRLTRRNVPVLDRLDELLNHLGITL